MGFNRLAGEVLPAAELNSFYSSAGLYGASSMGNDSYAITVNPIPNAYTAGDRYTFKADVGNTGAASLNVNSLGAKPIKKHSGIDLQDGDIQAGQIITVVYDGANFQLESRTPQRELIVKNADQSKTSDITYANDSQLLFNYAANSKYIVKLKLFVDGGNYSSSKIRLNTTQTINAALSYWIASLNGNGSSMNGFQNAAFGNPTPNSHEYIITAVNGNYYLGLYEVEIMLATLTAGVFSVQWAQQRSSGNPTIIYAGSTLEYFKFA